MSKIHNFKAGDRIRLGKYYSGEQQGRQGTVIGVTSLSLLRVQLDPISVTIEADIRHIHYSLVEPITILDQLADL